MHIYVHFEKTFSMLLRTQHVPQLTVLVIIAKIKSSDTMSYSKNPVYGRGSILFFLKRPGKSGRLAIVTSRTAILAL